MDLQSCRSFKRRGGRESLGTDTSDDARFDEDADDLELESLDRDDDDDDASQAEEDEFGLGEEEDDDDAKSRDDDACPHGLVEDVEARVFGTLLKKFSILF